LRIFNIVENLDKGAVENWLVNVFLESRKIRPEWEWTFYCILGKEGRLDEKVRSAGGEIIYAPVSISHKVSFLRHLRKSLERTKFDILHSHHDYLSGFYLLASTGLKFKRRILQIHNTDKALPVGSKFLQKSLLEPFRKSGIYFSDLVVGISEDTLSEFMGEEGRKNKKTCILYYGIDLSPFTMASDYVEFRRDLGLPEDASILLYVGRMTELKNPVFVVDILGELLKIRENVYAVFVGSGDLESEIRQRANLKGISNHIRIVGWSDHPAGIMKNSNLFVFPRVEYPKEGLGLVVVEAQAAGLPMLITRGIVKDAIVINELVNYNSLENSANQWAEQVDQILSDGPPISKDEALKRMSNSKFEINNAARNLIALYEQ
jgi:glycosyltransferase involved in cell wall biosynthesis